MKYSYFKGQFLPTVLRVNKLPSKEKEKRLQFWVNRFHHLFSQGVYDLAYEYIARVELSYFLDLDKSDDSRIMMWRMLVTDYRRAFSYYAEERFERLKKSV